MKELMKFSKEFQKLICKDFLYLVLLYLIKFCLWTPIHMDQE